MSASSLVYTVDEKGEINQLIQENAENVDLTDDNFSMIRSEISSYMGDFDELTFSDAYTFQSSMESSVMELLNQNMLDSLEEGLAEGERCILRGVGTLHVVRREGGKRRNPRTGEEVEIPPHGVVRFNPSHRPRPRP